MTHTTTAHSTSAQSYWCSVTYPKASPKAMLSNQVTAAIRHRRLGRNLSMGWRHRRKIRKQAIGTGRWKMKRRREALEALDRPLSSILRCETARSLHWENTYAWGQGKDKSRNPGRNNINPVYLLSLILWILLLCTWEVQKFLSSQVVCKL